MDSAVSALIVFNSELIAGGEFTAVGGVSANHIARWDGTQWQPLGQGVYGGVLALTVFNGEPIAGTGEPGAILRWDGTEWHTISAGLYNGGVSALAVLNGELIAGGSFTSIGGVSANRVARWDGAQWRPLGSGMNDWVSSLTVFNGQLIAGGVVYNCRGRLGQPYRPLGRDRVAAPRKRDGPRR
jgi:hypothetical protein